jgi:bacterioferritin (cytochrome b1)
MTTEREIVAALKEALQAELKAVKMYGSHAEVITDPEIVQGLRTILEVEEHHARLLVRRIEALSGKPAAAEAMEEASVNALSGDPDTVAEMLRADLAEEQWTLKHYAAIIADFVLELDDETLALLDENLADELRHARWLRDRLRLSVQSG